MEPTGKVKEIASKILSGKEAFPFGICSFDFAVSGVQGKTENSTGCSICAGVPVSILYGGAQRAQYLSICDGDRLPYDCRRISQKIL